MEADDIDFALDRLERAVGGLNNAATDLVPATVLARGQPLGTDAGVLADAIEAELTVLNMLMYRYG